MKNLLSLVLPGLLILSSLTCTKPRRPLSVDEARKVPPIVFYTSLADTLPQKTMDEIGAGDVMGVKIKNLVGEESRYFMYEANAQDVLKALAHMPIRMDSVRADINCSAIEMEHVMNLRTQISPTESRSSAFFWNIDSDSYQAFECVKDDEWHIVLVHKYSRQILHRVSYQA